jgi:hypothetical protein
MQIRVQLAPFAQQRLLDQVAVIFSRIEHISRHRLEAELLAGPFEPQGGVAVRRAAVDDLDLVVVLRQLNLGLFAEG